MEGLGIVLLIAGLILLGVEIGIPGFGVFGISGIVCMGIGVWLTAANAVQAVIIAVVLAVIVAVMIIVIMRFMKSKGGKKIVLERGLASDGARLSETRQDYLVGQYGKTLTDLKPSGKGRFDGVERDILAENGAWITKGKKVQITRIAGNSVFVTEKEEKK